MPRGKGTSNQLRCFCSRKPLLATYGLDEKGKVYVHVKIYKQARIYGELLITEGVVKVRCRECLRWHRVVIRKAGEAELIEDSVDDASLEAQPHP
jgi:hypothetical protein